MVMTPMDFWASAVPWEKAIKPAEKICILRKPRLTPVGERFWSIREKITTMIKPARVPSIGERTKARMIFFNPDQSSAEAPKWAMTAPIRPPTMAWEEDDGKP